MPNLVGIGLSQVPTNSMLGGLAYQSPDHASIKDLDLKNLSQINSEIADTAVDIFIYDTSKDSDGGAWRKRTTHTSWYNETLGTTTRGTRREFPAVAVIVAKGDDTITIYDGDDPDLPMWMVMPVLTGWDSSTKVSALNGIIVMTNHGYNGTMFHVKFIEDSYNLYDCRPSVSLNSYTSRISDRATVASYSGTQISNIPLAHADINDVAMTVLPNAPIDETTGLPIPTIAVGTDSGVSIIKDDGTVIDYTNNATTHDVVGSLDFNEDYEIVYTFDSSTSARRAYITPILSSDDETALSTSHADTTTGTIAYGAYSDSGNYSGFLVGRNINSLVTMNGRTFATGDTGGSNVPNGLSLINAQPAGVSTNGKYSLIGYATTSYNTGWMHGDIKGAFLSSIDDTNVTGSELITNGDSWTGASGSTPPTGWTGGNAATFDVIDPGSPPISGDDGVVLRLINAGSAQGGPNSYMYTSFTTVVGQSYTLSLVNYWNATITVGYKVGTSANGSENATASWVTAYGDPTVRVIKDFVATATTTYLTLFISSGTNAYGTLWDDVSVRPSDPDRSVNDKGLQVFGTVDKDPVATGAELVAYGGFNGSNYLRQPHNADLNVGTGDFYVMCWVKGNRLMLWHRVDSGSLDMRCEFPTSGGNANKPRFLFNNGGVTISFYATTAFDTTTWHHCVWVKRGARGGELYIDGVLNNSATASSDLSLNGTNSTFSIGNRADSPTEAFNGYVSLFRFGASAPSPEQIKKIYEDEKVLFQENAACTLYGSSDAVTALAYDDSTNLLYAGTSSGRSDFQGLRRINNTTTAVTTAMSASNGLVAEQ